VIFKVLCTYLIVINILSIILTVYDKLASKKRRARRIKENHLMLLGIFGGSLAMYVTMKLIHHKTHHSKFMRGLPTILTVQFLLLMIFLFFLT